MNRAETAIILLEAIAGMRPGGSPLKGLVFWLYITIAYLLLSSGMEKE